ncbi:MAG: VTT domain-containing protein [Nocardioidaceae bacterium]|nr:MAG: VTT domain-containing protein [Nocardioidaceae bacterium]
MNLVFSTFLFAFGSAVLPILNAEVYLGAVATRIDPGEAALLAIVASAGQTLGKIIWYAGARWFTERPWMQRKLGNPKVQPSFDKWQKRVEGRPWYGAAVLLCSAALGFPPLLIMAVLAGSLRMRFDVFVASCFVGRAIRFYLLLAGVSVFVH